MTPQDKRYAAYQIACAKICGWEAHPNYPEVNRFFKETEYGRIVCCIGGEEDDQEEMSAWGGGCAALPTYLDDASIDAVVRKLDYNQTELYCMNLMCDAHQMVKATPEQKSEALCRTLIGEIK